MSAALAWSGAPAHGRPSRRSPQAPGRPHLVLVPTGDAVTVRRPGLRVTRAGRLMLTTGVLVAAAALTAALVVGAVGGGTAIDHAVTVEPGQTLSEVAASELSGLPVDEGVARLQLVNELPGTQVSAGETLLVPAVG